VLPSNRDSSFLSLTNLFYNIALFENPAGISLSPSRQERFPQDEKFFLTIAPKSDGIYRENIEISTIIIIGIIRK